MHELKPECVVESDKVDSREEEHDSSPLPRWSEKTTKGIPSQKFFFLPRKSR